MEQSKRITRKEAAKLLGVCEQTVANLVSRGALSVVKQGQMFYLNRDEVKALVPKAQGLRDIEQIIAGAEAELREAAKRKVGAARVQKARCEFVEALSGTMNNWVRYAEVVVALYEAVVNSGLLNCELTAREKDILADIINFKPLEQIAARYGLTQERIRQIYGRALTRIVRFSKGIGENYQAMMQDASGWQDYAKGLEEANRHLEAELDAYRPKNERDEERIEFLCRDIQKHNLSARTTNWLTAAGVNTVGDLIKHRRVDIMRLRNIGRRSMAEIDRFLENNGIEWNN